MKVYSEDYKPHIKFMWRLIVTTPICIIVYRPLFERVMGFHSQSDASDISVRIILWGILATVVSSFFFQLSKKLKSKDNWLVRELVFVLVSVSSGTVGVGIFLLMYSLFIR